MGIKADCVEVRIEQRYVCWAQRHHWWSTLHLSI